MANQLSKDRAAALQFEKEPPRDKLLERKRKFEKLLAFVSKRNGWLTSVPGALDVALETLPDSTLPAELRELGYDVVEDGTGERILPHGIVERFARRADGQLEPITEGSTLPVTVTMTHAGITRVLRWSFDIG